MIDSGTLALIRHIFRLELRLISLWLESYIGTELRGLLLWHVYWSYLVSTWSVWNVYTQMAVLPFPESKRQKVHDYYFLNMIVCRQISFQPTIKPSNEMRQHLRSALPILSLSSGFSCSVWNVGECCFSVLHISYCSYIFTFFRYNTIFVCVCINAILSLGHLKTLTKSIE